MDSGRSSGGICKLLEIIEEQPAELAYDFRTKFQLSIFDIGGSVTWLEAVLLTNVLLRETDSWTQAVKSDWKYPVSREWIVQAHTFDIHAKVNSKGKPKPYPAPWPEVNTNKIGAAGQSRNRVRKLLDLMNPKEDNNG